MIEPILIAQGEEPIYLLPKMANRHGLIAGATGTGKTVTLQTLAESFSARGIPVFMAGAKAESAGAPPAAPGASVPEAARPSLLGTIGSVFQPTIGPRGAIHDSMATSMAKSAVRAASSQMGRQIMRGILGSFLGGARR